ncbi:MAG TPA: TonB-dependent receptor [Chthoniobacterales bacterium]|nr:TonB-dependent receptor [Chthoniobacterales bacterium]
MSLPKNFIIYALLLGLTELTTAQQPAGSPGPFPGAADGTISQAERVVVSGGEIERSETDKAQSVTVLNEDELKQLTQPSLGDTLATQPGVGGSGFTAGASRPVIRGQSDNRVRVLNNGTEVFDVSNLSPDHAPSISPLLSQSIEVVRGPATLLYGSGAIGGVVNVTDNLIPVEQPPEPISGEVNGRFDSADLERSGAMALTMSPFQHLVLHAEGSLLRTDDRRIPGFALDERIRAELTPEQRRNDGFGGNPEGTVPNTFVETKSFGIGGSYVWDKRYVGASYSRYLNDYGVPDNPEVDDPMVPPERVHLDVRKDQYNLRSSVVDPLPWLNVANLKLVYTDYKHDEIDGDAVGATFRTNGIDSRFELVHKPLGPLEGSIGTQVFWKDLSILGEEAFLQPTSTTQVAGFVFEEVKLDLFRIQFGARVEHQSVSIDSADPTLTSLTSPSQKDQGFWPISGAAGLIYDFTPGWQVALNSSYSQRAPTAEELFARGPHEATFQFIVGDPNLDVETNRSVDLTLRKTEGVITGFVSAFYSNYDGFIAFTPTGDFEDGVRVFDYTPKKAEFVGGETRADFHFLPLTVTQPNDSENSKSVKNVVTKGEQIAQKNPNDLFLRLQADYVYAEDADTSEPLPRITPLRYSASLNYESEHWSASIEGRRVSRQNRTAEFETSTPGYTFLNVNLGYKFQWKRTYNYLYVRGVNLLDAEARDHLSFLKEVLPLPGRGVVVGFRTTF